MTAKTTKKLNFISVAAMFIGVIMGAGYASGRESWQFFGVFGDKGYLGVVLCCLGYIAVLGMITHIAIVRDTSDIGEIVSFTGNRYLTEIIGYITAGFLFTSVISMTAAGGSFLFQQFGIHRAIGGGVIAVLIAVTVLGDFQRISGLFRYVVPMLFVVVITCAVIVLSMDVEQSGRESGFPPSDLAPNWWIASLLYVSYNILGTIPFGATSALNARSRTHAYLGTILGALLLSAMTLLLLLALNTDMEFTQSLDMPMLGYSARISPVVNIIYGVVLYISIYSAATSVFYGFTTKLPDNNRKKPIIIIVIIIGYILGLMGFKNVVAFFYPAMGYFGFLLIGMMTINFFRTIVGGNRVDQNR